MYPTFKYDINKMNEMYELAPVLTYEDIDKRLPQFEDILSKECAELDDITDVLSDVETGNAEQLAFAAKIQMADLLGDIIVYCASEAARWNIPLEDVLRIIMLSNQSKLGADGKPIKNPVNGKFEKGPYYWKPEPAIEHFLLYGNNGMTVITNENGVPALQLSTPTISEAAADSQQSETKET